MSSSYFWLVFLGITALFSGQPAAAACKDFSDNVELKSQSTRVSVSLSGKHTNFYDLRGSYCPRKLGFDRHGLVVYAKGKTPILEIAFGVPSGQNVSAYLKDVLSGFPFETEKGRRYFLNGANIETVDGTRGRGAIIFSPPIIPEEKAETADILAAGVLFDKNNGRRYTVYVSMYRDRAEARRKISGLIKDLPKNVLLEKQ